MKIESVLLKHSGQLMQLHNVTGAGLGEQEGREVILVFVKKKVPESKPSPGQAVLKNLEGFDTDAVTQINVFSS